MSFIMTVSIVSSGYNGFTAVYNRIIVILEDQRQIWIVVHITEYLWFHNKCQFTFNMKESN